MISSKQEGRPRINTAMTSEPELRERFTNHIRDATYQSSSDTYGKKVRKNEDWFEADIVKPAIAAKRTALLDHMREPPKKMLAALRKARNNAQRIARKCVEYCLNLCQGIQISADCGNIRAMCEGMKKVFGPSAIKIAPLQSTSGEVITNCSKRMERLVEHYQKLYSRENSVIHTAFKNTNPLPAMEELDAPLTIEKLSKASTL